MSRTLRAGLLLLAAAAFCRTPAWAAEKNRRQEQINGAVERGIAYLRKERNPQIGGAWGGRANDAMGATALVGLTLLECGLPETDKDIQKAADFVREKALDSDYVYSISLAIMFLDRLGDSTDLPLLESLTERLLAGQTKSGGWSYRTPGVHPVVVERLRAYYKRRADDLAAGKLPKKRPFKKHAFKPAPGARQRRLNALALSGDRLLTGDNSNTQFAAMALWIAGRHGLPVQGALEVVALRFRQSQQKSGGWSYAELPPNIGGAAPLMEGNKPTATMTCAGLVGLAVGHGAAPKPPAKAKGKKVNDDRTSLDPNKDRGVIKALVALGTVIGDPADAQGANLNLGKQSPKAYYFLWSLERVAAIYGLETIDKKDWYNWGVDVVLASQLNDGSWRGEFPDGGVDTCFALLFLRKSNLAKDLTLLVGGKVKNPGVAEVTGRKGKPRPQEKLELLEPGIKLGKGGGGKLVRNPEKNSDKKPEKKAEPKEEGPEKAVARLSDELVKAAPDEREKVLARLQDGKGLEYTEALAGSIPKLAGAFRAKARTALAARLARLTNKSLRDKMQDENLEIRWAAARASALKDKAKAKQLAGDLIALLEDKEAPVARAAHAALKEITDKDFGPDTEATQAERRAAVAKWKAWWKKQQ